jgi:hypothetical protein
LIQEYIERNRDKPDRMRMSKTKELMEENLNLIFDEGILDEGPSNEVYLTIKKYD